MAIKLGNMMLASSELMELGRDFRIIAKDLKDAHAEQEKHSTMSQTGRDELRDDNISKMRGFADLQRDFRVIRQMFADATPLIVKLSDPDSPFDGMYVEVDQDGEFVLDPVTEDLRVIINPTDFENAPR